MKSHLEILNQHTECRVCICNMYILRKLFTHLCSFIGFVYGEVCSTPLIGNLRKVKFFSRRRDCIELGSGSLTQARIIAAGGRERRAESGECSVLRRCRDLIDQDPGSGGAMPRERAGLPLLPPTRPSVLQRKTRLGCQKITLRTISNISY